MNGFSVTNIFRFAKGKIKKIPIGKHVFHIPQDMAWAYKNNQYYERNLEFWITKILSNYKDPIFFDIGANYGYYTIICSGLTKQTFAFEPVSRVYKALRKNIKLNNLSSVTSFNIGISNTNSTEKINLYSSSGNNSLFNRDIPKGHALQHIGKEEIVLKKLDTFVVDEHLPLPDLVKIDVEGAELYVLQEAQETFKQSKPTIVVEYSENTSKDAGYPRENILNKLLSITDYNIYGLSADYADQNLITHDNFNTSEVANVIATTQKLL